MTHVCPYCSSMMDLAIPEENAITFRETRLAATPCCKRPIFVMPRLSVTVEPADTHKTEDDWGEPFADKGLPNPAVETAVNAEPVQSTCLSCLFKVNPWSKQRTEEGWLGCRLGLIDHPPAIVEPGDVQMMVLFIDAPKIGFGWITHGGMAVNDQILTFGTRKCAFKQPM